MLHSFHLRMTRAALRLTQDEMARSLGVSATTLARWEQADDGAPLPGRAATVSRAEAALGHLVGLRPRGIDIPVQDGDES